MSLFDDAADFLDRGVTVAKGAVSNVACEQLGFFRAFCRMCEEGSALGYHERNGGNASYRLSSEDISSARSFFYDKPSSWVPLGVQVPAMGGQYLLITGSGKYLKNVPAAPASNAGIIELSELGDSWRIVWGLKDGASPTSEVAAHVEAHAARMLATDGANRVIYHVHPASTVALTALVEPDTPTITRLLWSCLTESIIAFPEGLGVLAWMIPGSAELAQATAAELGRFQACVWQLHGVLASGESCDAALGLVQSIDKAAYVYLQARSAAGGVANLPHSLTSDDLRAIAQAYGLPIDESFL